MVACQEILPLAAAGPSRRLRIPTGFHHKALGLRGTSYLGLPVRQASPTSTRWRVFADGRDFRRPSRTAEAQTVTPEQYDPSLPLAFKVARLFKLPIEEIFEHDGK